MTGLALLALVLVAVERFFRANREIISIGRRQELYLALSRCSTRMTQRASTTAMFEGICEALVGVPNIMLVWIGLGNDTDDLVRPIVARGSALGYLDGIVVSRDAGRSEGHGAIGRSMRALEPVWCNDFLTDPATAPWRAKAAPYGFRGSASLPILRDGQAFGVISIYTDTVGYFDGDTRPLLREFAVQLGLAMEAREAEQAAAVSAAKARRAAAKVAIANERLDAIIHASSDFICEVDRDGRFVAVSGDGPFALADTRQELLGRSCLDFAEPGSRGHAALRAALDPGDPVAARSALNIAFNALNGRQVPMSWSMVWSGEEQVFHCVARDLTEFRALEDKVRHAQRLDSIGVLTGGIAHDFNNLLAVIIGSSEFLVDRLPEGRLHHLAELILQTAERGARLTGQLLAFARRQPLTPETCEIGPVLQDAWPLLDQATGPAVALDLEIAPNLPPLLIDRTQLVQALMNLCVNARDAMPAGGAIRIDVGRAGAMRETLSANAPEVPAEFVAIRVRDQGGGISPADLDRIFEPFFTTKGVGKGAGLGLSMVHGFVSQSHGVIDIASRKGDGASFTLMFPPAEPVAGTGKDEPSSAGAALPVIAEATLKAGPILLVEDHELLRDHTRALLEELGCTVIEAGDGAAAIAAIAGHKDIRLVITDVALTGEIDGWALGRRVMEIRPALPVIYVTGFTEAAVPPYVRPSEVLQKPYGNRQLLAAIAAAHMRPRPAALENG